MANHTPAEIERIKKRQDRKRWVLESISVLAIGVFVLFLLWVNKRNADLEKAALAAPTPDPALTDERVKYLCNFKDSGYSLDSEAARLALTDSAGSPVQLMTYLKGESLCVKLRFYPQKADSDEDCGSSLFPEIDVSEPLSADRSAEAGEAAAYFIPLVGADYKDIIVKGITDALTGTEAGKDLKRTFIAGVYLFSVDYSAASGLMTVCAEPA